VGGVPEGWPGVGGGVARRRRGEGLGRLQRIRGGYEAAVGRGYIGTLRGAARPRRATPAMGEARVEEGGQLGRPR
jgi:hypothetical protein